MAYSGIITGLFHKVWNGINANAYYYEQTDGVWRQRQKKV